MKINVSFNLIRTTVCDDITCVKSAVTCGRFTTRMIRRLNEIFKQADIQFDLVLCSPVVGTDVDFNGNFTHIEESFEQERLFVNDVINVFVVPAIDDGVNAYHVNEDKSFIVLGERDPYTWKRFSSADMGSVLAHEIGHDLGLGHHPTKDNLMYEFGPGGIDLTDGQIETARRAATKYAGDFLDNASRMRPVDIDFGLRVPNKGCDGCCCCDC